MTHSGKKWEIIYSSLVYSDLTNIDKYSAEKIKTVIELRLTTSPELYGMPLRRGLKGFRKLRVGDYRIIYFISGSNVLVEGIGHRKNIYEIIKKRLGL